MVKKDEADEEENEADEPGPSKSEEPVKIENGAGTAVTPSWSCLLSFLLPCHLAFSSSSSVSVRKKTTTRKTIVTGATNDSVFQGIPAIMQQPQTQRPADDDRHNSVDSQDDSWDVSLFVCWLAGFLGALNAWFLFYFFKFLSFLF